MWELRGTYKGKPYTQPSFDIGYLQSLLTKILRNDGTGFIWKMS
jgi:hypothetical protein